MLSGFYRLLKQKRPRPRRSGDEHDIGELIHFLPILELREHLVRRHIHLPLMLLLQDIKRRLRLAFERIEHRDEFYRGTRVEGLIARPRATPAAADERDLDVAVAIRGKGMCGGRDGHSRTGGEKGSARGHGEGWRVVKWSWRSG